MHLAHAPLWTSRLYALLSLIIGLAGWLLFLYFRGLYVRAYPPLTPITAAALRMSLPSVDLVVVFKAAGTSLVKAKMRADAQEAEIQYNRLIATLKNGGLYATGRRGASQGQVIVLVACPQEKIAALVQRERYSDFLYGLSTTNLASVADTSDADRLAPADRLRLIHDFVTSTTKEGGLGVITGLPEWNRVESVMTLHDHEFNHAWVRSWSTHRVGLQELDKIRDQFGEAVALYFAFLADYAKALWVPAAFGVGTYLIGSPYSYLYSVAIVLWAICFTEWWRIRERILSVRWHTRGSFRVERHRAHFDEKIPRWRRDLRTTASAPVIFLFAVFLAGLLTSIFVFEAFITQLYTGPGHQYISLAPTILFMALVPRFMAVYQAFALKLTHWENHAHQSTHEASLTLKTFSLSAVVAYLGISLSAFVYVPFGGDVMARVQTFLFRQADHPIAASTHSAAKGYASVAESLLTNATLNATSPAFDGRKPLSRGLWEADALNARARLNPARLQDQMFAFTVTNQVINVFLEVGLPWVLRGFGTLRGKAADKSGKKKRVGFEDDKANLTAEGKQERELLERVREEVSLPDYALYLDYAEMATQFGYVALWSTIWPLAPVMALLNNILELRADAYKITVHQRRPIPVRSDTIGPWLQALESLAWIAALTNGALVYLFQPQPDTPRSTTLNDQHTYTAEAIGRAPQTTRELLAGAFALSLLASHAAIVARMLIRHFLERALWSGNEKVAQADASDKKAREEYMRSLGVSPDKARLQSAGVSAPVAEGSFWATDEGLDEIRRNIKDN